MLDKYLHLEGKTPLVNPMLTARVGASLVCSTLRRSGLLHPVLLLMRRLYTMGQRNTEIEKESRKQGCVFATNANELIKTRNTCHFQKYIQIP